MDPRSAEPRLHRGPAERHVVTDFTYVRTWAGIVYAAFAIDVFSRVIVGWHASSIKDTTMALAILKMPLRRRDQGGTPAP